MKELIDRLSKTEPAQVRGVAAGIVSGLSLWLVSLQPLLDGVAGWKEAGVIVFVSLVNLSQGKSTRNAVYSPATYSNDVLDARAIGQSEMQNLVKLNRSLAAQKGVVTKAMKAQSESEPVATPNPKPKVQKRPKGKQRPVPATPQSQAKPAS